MKFLSLLSMFFLMSCTSTNSAENGTSKQDIRNKIIYSAEYQLGVKYSVDGKHPATGFDCSGFTEYIFNQHGFKLKGGSNDIARLGKTKSQKKLQKGDLAFFGTKKTITHIGIISEVNSDGIEMIHSSSQSGIRKENITKSPYWNDKLLFFKDIIN